MFLSAGESSGDLHGAGLARALRKADPSIELIGLGGDRMVEAGVRTLAGLDRLAVMGFTEVVRHLPFFVKLRRTVRRTLVRRPVDLLVPIDYPGFNLPLAEFARRRSIPVLYYIAPQVWAWRPRRARRLAEACDRVCAVFDFEVPILREHGAQAYFVGHPLLDHPPPVSALARTVAGEHEMPGERDPDAASGEPRREAPILGLFPGSRAHEVERIYPTFAEAAGRLQSEIPGLRVCVGRAPHIGETPYAVHRDHRLVSADQALRVATAALAKSGTITLQLALAGVPFVVGHRVGPLTYRIARRLVDVDHVALANLVAGRRVVTELIQDEATPDRLVSAVRPLLERGSPERRRVSAGLGEVRRRLGEPGCAERVAGHALAVLEGET